MRWATLGKLVMAALEEPDPKSPVERLKRAHAVYVEVGDACELANTVLSLSDPAEAGKKEEVQE